MNEAKPHGRAHLGNIVVQITCFLFVMVWCLYVFTLCLVRHGVIQNSEENGCGLEMGVFMCSILELTSCNNMPT